MTFWAKLAILIAFLAIYGAGVWKTHDWYDAQKEASDLLAAQKQAKELAVQRDEIAADYEKYRSKSQADINAINQKWRNYAKTSPDCKLPTGALQLLQSGSIPGNADTR